jgi:hypothetical protein
VRTSWIVTINSRSSLRIGSQIDLQVPAPIAFSPSSGLWLMRLEDLDKKFQRRADELGPPLRCVVYPSAVVGSMVVEMNEMALAGKPPIRACSLINSALGAR